MKGSMISIKRSLELAGENLLHALTTDGTAYRFRWRGDDVVGIYPNTDYLPFYPTLKVGE